MKKNLLLLAMACMTIMASAETYALYGTVPTGATDLTAGMTATASGSAVLDAESPLTFTGAGLSGSQYCNTNNHVKLTLAEAQTMSLTDQYALHVFIKKAEGATGDVQICFCNDSWNNHRAPFLIDNSDISDTEYSEIVLRYEDRNTSISWNSYGDAAMIGTDVSFSGEIIRLCAASGEQFEISSIYVVSQEYVDPKPEVRANKRYYFYRPGDLPVSDSITMVDLRLGEGTTIQLNNLIQTEEEGYTNFTMNGSWFSFNQNLSATTDMSDVKVATWSLVAKVRTNVADGSLNIRLNNAGECFVGDNLPLLKDGSWETIVLPLSTSKRNLSFTKSMSGTILQIHANGSTAEDYFDIEYFYLTDDATIPEDLEPTPTAVEQTFILDRATKIIRGGQLYIQREGNVYNVAGSLVK